MARIVSKEVTQLSVLTTTRVLAKVLKADGKVGLEGSGSGANRLFAKTWHIALSCRG